MASFAAFDPPAPPLQQTEAAAPGAPPTAAASAAAGDPLVHVDGGGVAAGEQGEDDGGEAAAAVWVAGGLGALTAAVLAGVESAAAEVLEDPRRLRKFGHRVGPLVEGGKALRERLV